MKSLSDYTAPPRQDFDARPNASQVVAAQHRERESDDTPTVRIDDRRYVAAASAGLVIVAFVVLATIQLSGQPRPLQARPTVEATASAPQNALSASQGRATALPTPIPTLAPTAAPTAFSAPPQIGRGLSVVEPIETQHSASVLEAAPTYLEVVGQQAQHTPRGGVTGPCEGACAIVPTAAPAQLRIVGAQAPHRVR